MVKNAGSAERIGVPGNGPWWKPLGQREIMRSQGTLVGAHRLWALMATRKGASWKCMRNA